MINAFSVMTYSPSDVKLIVSGYLVAGWETISISRVSQGFQPIPGIRGKDTRSKNPKTSAILSVTTVMTSQSNDVFSYIHDRDLEYGTGRLVITLKDNSGRSVFSSNEGFIRGFPETVFSGNAEYRAWEIYCQSTESYYIGGNSRPVNSIFSNAVDFVSNII